MRRAFSRKAAIPHDRRSPCRVQDNPAGCVRVATPHGLPVLVCTRVRGQLQKLAHVSAHLAVVPNDKRQASYLVLSASLSLSFFSSL